MTFTLLQICLGVAGGIVIGAVGMWLAMAADGIGDC